MADREKMQNDRVTRHGWGVVAVVEKKPDSKKEICQLPRQLDYLVDFQVNIRIDLQVERAHVLQSAGSTFTDRNERIETASHIRKKKKKARKRKVRKEKKST